VDNHSSGIHVTMNLVRPTRILARERQWIPIRSCSRWGLHCHTRYRLRGALLPHLFTLTCHPQEDAGGIFSAALSVGSRPPGVTWHLSLWSPDFPLPITRSGCL